MERERKGKKEGERDGMEERIEGGRDREEGYM